MKVLITGAAGMLGRDVAAVAASMSHEVVALDRDDLDVTDPGRVERLIVRERPGAVINCAAWTKVDAAEEFESDAELVNGKGAGFVSDAAAKVGATILYPSTDYVFDGAKPVPEAYVEWDTTNPLSVYGRSKLGGEHEIRALAPTATVVRTSWVCGAHGNNMVKTVLQLLADDPGRELAFVADQHGCPTFTADLAPALRRLAAARLPGTFHVTNQGPTTWHGFVQGMVAAAGGSTDQVRAVTTADLQPPRPAPRPANSVLDSMGLRLAGQPLLPHWSESLERLVKELRA